MWLHGAGVALPPREEPGAHRRVRKGSSYPGHDCYRLEAWGPPRTPPCPLRGQPQGHMRCLSHAQHRAALGGQGSCSSFSFLVLCTTELQVEAMAALTVTPSVGPAGGTGQPRLLAPALLNLLSGLGGQPG